MNTESTVSGSHARPPEDATTLVRRFAAAGASRYDALVALGELSPDTALPALRRGLRDDDWHVRHWCAIALDQLADADALADLIDLLDDPHYKVRLWAVHSLACDHCKPGVEAPCDIVPLLIERAERDEHPRVRKMATVMLAHQLIDERALSLLRRKASRTDPGDDPKLRMHARQGLERYREAGLG
ncbi:MAG: hypothetical protein DWQ36_20715 [Acidobacteria bacterium]|nr:MAG: hypothetical protein DWQ30_21140 [Acidobacteriota bacterium]REK03290.1 MAG: hypothetical protein DWQ36_20715 [Acidobacteriota bacterium]